MLACCFHALAILTAGANNNDSLRHDDGDEDGYARSLDNRQSSSV